jgi:hypothetical protein
MGSIMAEMAGESEHTSLKTLKNHLTNYLKLSQIIKIGRVVTLK